MTRASLTLRGLGLAFALGIGLGGCAMLEPEAGKGGSHGAGIDPDDLRSAVVMGRVVLGGMAAERLAEPDHNGARAETANLDARRKLDFDRVTELQNDQLRRTVVAHRLYELWRWERVGIEPPTAAVATDEVRTAQRLLRALGFYTGAIDGRAGPRTAKAVRRFEAKKGLVETGVITPELIAQLRAAL
jgi:localization factor PodJL